MRNILAIAGKECRIYLTTWTSYLLLGVFMLFSAFLFTLHIVDFQQRSMDYTRNQASWMLSQMNLTDWVIGGVFGGMAVLLLILIPMHTMGLLAEERKGKTLELMMTAPVRPIEIILGKYLGALAVVGVMLALTIVFPILLHVFGSTDSGQSPIDWNTVGVGYLGLSLMAAAFVAIGLFASAITDSQVVAAVVGFAVLFLFFLISNAQVENESWRQVLQYLSITSHLDDFLRGIIKLQGVVYYLSVVFLGIFLSYRVVEAQRWR